MDPHTHPKLHSTCPESTLLVQVAMELYPTLDSWCAAASTSSLGPYPFEEGEASSFVDYDLVPWDQLAEGQAKYLSDLALGVERTLAADREVAELARARVRDEVDWTGALAVGGSPLSSLESEGGSTSTAGSLASSLGLSGE